MKDFFRRRFFLASLLFSRENLVKLNPYLIEIDKKTGRNHCFCKKLEKFSTFYHKALDKTLKSIL
jgi:hypothetical protein